MDQALRMVTTDAAYTLGVEGKVGSIAPGKHADFAVLEQDPYVVPRAKIRDIKVWCTVVGGGVSGVRDQATTRVLKTMRYLIRICQRLAILGLGVLSVWLIVFVVFKAADRKLPLVLALSAAYGLGAYVIIPRAIRLGLKVLQRQHVPSYTITGDGLPGDPVNLVLIGTLAQLRSAFATAGWLEAERLSLATSWRMTWAFLRNTPYPTAPFSTLYLFGRGQDIGFQKAIDNSPRKRHHVRFWALSLADSKATVGTADFWLNTDRPPDGDRVLWVGAVTRDTGFGLTRISFQITHATDSDTSAERDFLMNELKTSGVIGDATIHKAGDELITEHVNHYTTDGEVAVAGLTAG